MEIQNKLIDKFMGANPVENIPYDSDWNLLMPVVEKIETVDVYSCLHIDKDDVYLHRKNDEMLYFSEGSKIATVYKAVVEFIKWYNEQN